MKNFHYNCLQNTNNFQFLIMFYRETIQFLYLCNLVYLKFTLSLKEIVLNLFVVFGVFKYGFILMNSFLKDQFKILAEVRLFMGE